LKHSRGDWRLGGGELDSNQSWRADGVCASRPPAPAFFVYHCAPGGEINENGMIDLGGRGVRVVEGKHRRDAITVGYRSE
jgi:hypothetical protein